VAPVFLKNFITFAKSALNLQQNFSKYNNARDLMANILENSNKYITPHPPSCSSPLLSW